MLLSVIIISYNTKDLTVQAVQSVVQQVRTSRLLRESAEVIVIDNNSVDESVSALRELAKTSVVPVKVVARDKNAGFAVANNIGFATASGQYLLLLNSDTIVHDGALDRLVTTFEEHPVDELTSHSQPDRRVLDRLGILAASLVNPDGSPQPQGGSFPTLWSLAAHMLMLDDLPVIGKWLPSTQHTGRRALVTAQDGVFAQDWVGGTAMMIRKQTLDEIGPLDEQIFMYGEDVEWCMRARNHHWDVAIHPAAIVTHYGSQSSSSATAIRGELLGYLYIWSKLKPQWQVPVVRALIKIGVFLRSIVFGTMKSTQAKAATYRQLLSEV